MHQIIPLIVLGFLTPLQQGKWEQDYLARFEQPELKAVRDDIDACVNAADEEDFLIDVEKLKADSNALVAVDDPLTTRKVI